MAKKKLPVSLFELIWYPICAAVIIWGLTYVVLGLINQFNDFSSLQAFANDFKANFKLDLYFWGLIIIAIAVVAAVVFAAVSQQRTQPVTLFPSPSSRRRRGHGLP